MGDKLLVQAARYSPLLPSLRLWRYRRLVTPFAVVIIALLTLMLIPPGRRTVKNWFGFGEVPAQKSLLVLPFTNVGGDPGNQAFCDGLMETLTSELTQLERFRESLWVIPASDVRERGIVSAREALQSLRVNLVVTGSVQRFSDSYRLTLNLVDTKNLRQLRSAVITDRTTNLSALQNDVVMKMAEMLEVELRPETRRVLTAGHTTVPGAYEFYLRGRGYLRRYEKLENIDSAIGFFNSALEQDSLYALAYAGLGEAYWRKYKHSKDPRWVEYAVRNCERAVELNDQLEPVRVTLGLIHTGTGRYEEAVTEFQKALALDPASAAAKRGLAKAYEAQGRIKEAELTYKEAIKLKPDYWAGYNVLGVFYYRHGRYEDAVTQFHHVANRVPLNAKGYTNLGGAYFNLDRWNDAKEMFKRSVNIEPNYKAYSNLATIYFYEEQYSDAARMYDKALQIDDNDYRVWGNLASAYHRTPDEHDKMYHAYQRAVTIAEEQMKVNPRDPDLLSHLAIYNAMIGEHARARGLLKQVVDLEPDNPEVIFRIGDTYEHLGNREMALEWIGKALDSGYPLALIENEAGLTELRKDERFQVLLQRNKEKHR